MVTLAPETTAPDASNTVPPVRPLSCPQAVAALRVAINANTVTRRLRFVIILVSFNERVFGPGGSFRLCLPLRDPPTGRVFMTFNVSGGPAALFPIDYISAALFTIGYMADNCNSHEF